MEYRKLLDVCDFKGGVQPPKQEWISEEQDGYVRMLQIRDFTQGEEKFIRYVPDSPKLRKCTEEDILLTRYGYIGQVVTGLSGAYNVALLKVIPKIDIDRRYLRHYFSSDYFRRYLQAHAGARAAVSGFNQAELKSARIPVPTAAECAEIVSRLQHVELLIAKQKAQLRHFELLPAARFSELFGNETTSAEVRHLCTDIVDCPHSTPKYEGELTYPAIRTTDIRNGYISWTKMRYVSAEEYRKRTAGFTPQAGDIVYGREGTCGNAAILPEGNTFCLGQRVMLFRPDSAVCTPEYLLYALLSDAVKRQAAVRNVGSIVPHVNIADAKRFTVKLPPLEQQNAFSAFVRQVDRTAAAAELSLSKLENIRKSMLQEYFG